ncbi:MAG: hypothetical protein RIR26_2643 [Pseudomonadota bacterium]
MRFVSFFSFLLLMSAVQGIALAQDAPSAESAQTQKDDGAERKKLEKKLEAAIQRRVKETLEQRVDDFMSRRIERTGYTIGIESTVDRKRLESLTKSLAVNEIPDFIASVVRKDYEALRPYLKNARISLGIADYLSEAEWEPVVNTLQAQFDASGDNIETVESTPVSMPLPLQERVIKTQAQEELKRLEREYELKKVDRDYEFENIKKMQDEKERRLEVELQKERKEKDELSKQLLNDENLSERMVKEKPLLTRLLATGAGIGSVLFFALLAFGIFVILGLRFLGSSIFKGTNEVARALRAGPEQLPASKQVNPFSDEAGEEGESEKEDLLLEFEGKPQFKEAAEQLRGQVMRDMKTAAAVLSKVVEQEKYGEVIAIFDLLGPEISQKVFALFSPYSRRLLQRAYFTGAIKRVKASTLFNRVNEFRTMLATTDVLMKDGNDKQFAQVMLSYSDEEVAKAIYGLAPDQAAAMMTILPPDRMLRIIRKMEQSFGKNVLNTLGQIVHLGKRITDEVLETFTRNIQDEKKMKFEEDKRYLQSVLTTAEQDEFEVIAAGLEFNARLLLEVIGVRATVEDMWAQPMEVLEGLFSLLELEPLCAVLYTSPDEIRYGVMRLFPERKRILSEDALDNLKKDEKYREQLLKTIPVSQKVLLQKLGEMASSGLVSLPSRVRLLALAEEQELQAGHPPPPPAIGGEAVNRSAS